MSLIALNVVLGSANRKTPPEAWRRGSGDTQVSGSWLCLEVRAIQKVPRCSVNQSFFWSYSKCKGLVSPS